MKRFLLQYQMFRISLKENAAVYHFHDPELILLGLILKVFKKKVIYDVHENVSKQILTKEYIPFSLRKIISLLVRFIEYLSLFFFDKIIIAGEDIGFQCHFRRFLRKIVLLRNFPTISLSERDIFPKARDKVTFIYSGGLSRDRGILEIIQAFKKVKNIDIKLLLLGSFTSDNFKKTVMDEIDGVENIEFIPAVSYMEMFTLLAKCHVGLICFHPTSNNIEALSGRNNKIYEYMQAGLAIIGSNFPRWKDFIEGNRIGITVDSQNVSDIKSAIEFLISNPKVLEEMGYNSKRLSKNYSWEAESKKLINLYNKLLGEGNRNE